MIFGSKAAPNPKHNCTGAQLRHLVDQLDALGFFPEEVGINTTVPGGAPAPSSITLTRLDDLDEEPACYVLRFGEGWSNAAQLIRTLSAASSVDAAFQFLATQARPGSTYEQAQRHLLSLTPVQDQIQQFLRRVFGPAPR